MKDFFSNIFKKATDFISEQAQNLEKLKDNVVEHLDNMKQQEEDKNTPQPTGFQQIKEGTFKLPDGNTFTINSSVYATNTGDYGSYVYHYDFTETGVTYYVLHKNSHNELQTVGVTHVPFEALTDWEKDKTRIDWQQATGINISIDYDVEIKRQRYYMGESRIEEGDERSIGHLTASSPEHYQKCKAFWDYFESKLPENLKANFQAGASVREASFAKAVAEIEEYKKTMAYYDKMDVIVEERKQELIDSGEWVEPEKESYASNSSSSSSSKEKEKEKEKEDKPTQRSGKATNINVKIKNDTDEPFTVYNQNSGGSYRLTKGAITTIKMDEGDKLFYYEGGKKGHLILTASPDMEGKVQNYSKI